jgi:O-antigen/teichoic acid export membrane protein
MIIKLYRQIMGRTLYKNSLYLMLNSGMLAFSGFLFWLVAARIYNPYEIGIATTLFSAILMISGISMLGLNSGLLRYIPKSNSFDKRCNSSIIIISIGSIFFAGIYLILLPFISQDLLFVRENVFLIALFTLFTITNGINEIIDSIFLALKKTVHIVQKNVSSSIVKLVLPLVLISFGAFGIVSSLFISVGIGLLIGFVLLYKTTPYQFTFRFSKSDVSDMATYSFGTFLSGQISNIPMYLLPILITAKLSVTQTAYYFIAASIANFMFFIPKVVTQNLLVEASHDEKKLKSHLMHSAIIIFSNLLPLTIGILFFGHYILSLFGKTYSQEGFHLLQLLTGASLLGSINALFGTILAVKKQVKVLILTNAVYSITMLLATYMFLSKGIVYVGYATIFAQILLVVVNAGILQYKKYTL